MTEWPRYTNAQDIRWRLDEVDACLNRNMLSKAARNELLAARNYLHRSLIAVQLRDFTGDSPNVGMAKARDD